MRRGPYAEQPSNTCLYDGPAVWCRYAQLVVRGQRRGLNAFIVPLRDTDTGETLPGVTAYDMGAKMGRNALDNGLLCVMLCGGSCAPCAMPMVGFESARDRNHGGDARVRPQVLHTCSHSPCQPPLSVRWLHTRRALPQCSWHGTVH